MCIQETVNHDTDFSFMSLSGRKMPLFHQEDESCILDRGGQVSSEELTLKDLELQD